MDQRVGGRRRRRQMSIQEAVARIAAKATTTKSVTVETADAERERRSSVPHPVPGALQRCAPASSPWRAHARFGVTQRTAGDCRGGLSVEQRLPTALVVRWSHATPARHHEQPCRDEVQPAADPLIDS